MVRAAIAAAGLGGDGGAGMTHVHEDIGAFVLGALDADGEKRVREHLAACPECAAAHAELAGIPGLLDLAVVTGATEDEPLPPAIEERLLDRFARERVERPRAPSLAPAARVRPARARSRARPSRWRCSSSGSTSRRNARPPGVPVPARVRADQHRAGQRQRARRAAHDRGRHGRPPVGQQPADRRRLRGLLRRARLERERGHVPRRRQGQRVRDPHGRGQEGPVRPHPPRPPRAHGRRQGRPLGHPRREAL